MELRLNISPSERKDLMALYESAFPSEERRPSELMPPDDPAFRFYAVDTDGLITAWEFPGYTYVEHFAVYPDRRGGGVGSRALALLSGPVILEVEPPESGETARRRIEFYRRNGFELTDYPYVQPPYAPGLPEVPLRLMIRGKLPITVAEAATTIRSRVYGYSDQKAEK